MYLSNFTEINVLRCFLGVPFVPPSTPYAGLSSTDPGEDGSGAFELAYEGYTRMPFAATVPAPVAGIANSIGFSNQAEIKFAKAPADQATAQYLLLYDSLNGGNMMAYARLDTPKQIKTGTEPVIRLGEARYWLASMGTTDELKTRILNVFRGIAMQAITPYASLANGAEELSGGNFARVPATFTEPVLLATGAHEITSAALIEFAVANVALGNYDTDCIYDAATGGSKLLTHAGTMDYYAAGDRTLLYERLVRATEEVHVYGVYPSALKAE